MKITRREALGAFAGALPTIHPPRASAQQSPEPTGLAIEKGPFQGTRDSLKTYRIPEWFRDAKFGIWAHWGPQSAAEDGDWYARNMYIEGSPQYKYHLEHYGHPSKVGFKDVIATFSGAKWDPEHLMDLYKQAGAKYFVSMGVHHDNFDMWNSKYQPRWNAAVSGPKKDIVGIWKQAARKRGLRFGVSEHLSNSFDWFAPSHLSDKSGPNAGVPYDGSDPSDTDLYHDYTGMPANFAATAKAMGRDAPESWKKQYFSRIKDLIDQHQPDILYTDGAIPFQEYGVSLVAHLYNVSAASHGGKVQAVYQSKGKEDCVQGTCALDLERGIVDKIWPDPWQTDTCIGQWHYKKGITYKTPKTVIDMLVDIVSRNGNLLLNFPLPGSGELDPQELQVLSGITQWMAVNGDAIFGTRPWKVYGTGPGTQAAPARDRLAFNERARKDLTAQDVRFTRRDNTLYAFLMGWPEKETSIAALGLKSEFDPGKIGNVELLGHKGSMKWKQDGSSLTVRMPAEKPVDYAVALKIAFA
ncbi:MAG: alpha-L-fucosidase [Acidobacteriota bacterium]|nr:alpha-L-fucosidase [Acidobacteriota bacterium]